MPDQNPFSILAVGRPLLFIYDETSFQSRAAAWFRGGGSWSFPVRRVPVKGGLDGLRYALDDLLAGGEIFQRCVFDTNGAPGQIHFGNQILSARFMDTWLGHGGYHKLFPFYWSRIYFVGPHIADNDAGWDFLDAAGKIFLKIGGGETFASGGGQRFLFPMTLMTGHYYHKGDTCYSRWAPGGVFLDHVRK
jgi:hypothetical protein